MDYKLILLLLFTIGSNAQIRLPVVTRQNNLLNAAGLSNRLQTIPSGNVRQFLTYPTLRSADEGYGGYGYGQAGLIGPAGVGLVRGIAAAPAVVAAPDPALLPIPAAVPAPTLLERVATLGLTNGLTGGIALGANAQVLGPVLAAIITQRTAEVVDVPTPQDVITPQVLIVEPNLLPVTIEFRSQSSPVNINQVHIPGPPGEFKETRSEEEPDRVLHEVVKPVIQEVREIIQPFRRITQQILPVQEEVHSVVARGERQQVIQEVAIPPPAPLAVPVPVADAVAVAAPRVAVAQPGLIQGVRQPVTLERTLAVEPVLTALAQPIAAGPALTGTVVRAGLIGGARIIQAPGIFDVGINPQGLGTRAIISGLAAQDGGIRIGNPFKREAVEDTPVEVSSLNNRPNGPVKREVNDESKSS